MTLPTDFVSKLEAQLRADIEAASVAGRPLFGSATDGALFPSAKALQERALARLESKCLSPWSVLSDREAARHTGVSASWLHRMRGNADGPPCLPAGDDTVLYPAGELFFWLEQGRDESAKGAI